MNTSHWSQVSLHIRSSLIKSSNPLLSPAFQQATPLPLRRPSEIAEDKAGASASRGAVAGDRRTRRTDDDRQLSCPRCNSSNTKFCYYNNYSLTQPRYFCKTCRRYWTEGGSLRNVPVGGGTRKNKRNYASASAPPISPKPSSNSNECVSSSMQNPNCVQGFNLGFHHHEGFSNMEILGLHDGYRGFSHDTGLGLGFLPHGAQEHDVVLEESREQQGFWNGMIW